MYAIYGCNRAFLLSLFAFLAAEMIPASLVLTKVLMQIQSKDTISYFKVKDEVLTGFEISIGPSSIYGVFCPQRGLLCMVSMVCGLSIWVSLGRTGSVQIFLGLSNFPRDADAIEDTTPGLDFVLWRSCPSSSDKLLGVGIRKGQLFHLLVLYSHILMFYQPSLFTAFNA